MNQVPQLGVDLRPLWSGFHQSAVAFPDRSAVEVNGQMLTYVQLHNKAASLAATLARHSPSETPPLTAVFSNRSVTAFAGVLGALFHGHGYVPLDRTFPFERSRHMLQHSKCRSLIVDGQSETQLEEILAYARDQMLLIFPDRDDVKDLARRWPQHFVLGSSDLESPDAWSPPASSTNAIAYLLFTSGSTGTPKAVMVSHGNVRHYIDWAVGRYQVTEEDRVSQIIDLTFDLSAHDMFVAWECGACVCCPTQKERLKPSGFINDSRLTMWMSVPSTAVFMRRLGLLKPGKYPRLRLSLFCGEALPAETARHWAMAAPNSVMENLYGPTELTIACTAYRWDRTGSTAECEHGIVPVGEPFNGMEALIVDEQLREVKPGAVGELLMTGPQLSLGYWQDEERTARAFVVPPGRDRVYYRTGDRVRRPLAGKPMTYLGRADNQIKIFGQRVELGEVEAVVRAESGVDGVVALGWPINSSGADGIEVFLETGGIDLLRLRNRVAARLPGYMVPRRIHLLPDLPVNTNGKFDRQALLRILEAKSRSCSDGEPPDLMDSSAVSRSSF